MPNQGMTEKQVADIIEYLKWITSEPQNIIAATTTNKNKKKKLLAKKQKSNILNKDTNIAKSSFRLKNIFPYTQKYKFYGKTYTMNFYAVFLDNFVVEKYKILNGKLSKNNLEEFIKINKENHSTQLKEFLDFKNIKYKVISIKEISLKNKILSKFGINNYQELYENFDNGKFKYVFTTDKHYIWDSQREHYYRKVIFPSNSYKTLYVIQEPIGIGFKKLKKYNRNKKIFYTFTSNKGRAYFTGYSFYGGGGRRFIKDDNDWTKFSNSIEKSFCRTIGTQLPSEKDRKSMIYRYNILCVKVLHKQKRKLISKVLSQKELNILTKQDIPNYNKVMDKIFVSKKKNGFGRVVKKETKAWTKVLLTKVSKEKNSLDRQKEMMKLLSFVIFKHQAIYKNLQRYIIQRSDKKLGKKFGVVLAVAGLKSYLETSIGFGTLPIYDINIANYSSKNMKVVGKINYTKLGILLFKQLILQSTDKEDYIDRALLLNSYILTHSFNIKTITKTIQSLFVNSVFNSKIKNKFGGLYDETVPIDFMINFYSTVLIQNANNAKINALIYHLVKWNAIPFMQKDKKVFENYKYMKKIYLKYKEIAHKE